MAAEADASPQIETFAEIFAPVQNPNFTPLKLFLSVFSTLAGLFSGGVGFYAGVALEGVAQSAIPAAAGALATLIGGSISIGNIELPP